MADIQALCSLLAKTFDPVARREAEASLLEGETSPGFAIALLRIVQEDSVDPSIRFAAAVFFKNLVKRHWKLDEDVPSLLVDADRDAVRQQLVAIMVSVPEKLQLQLSDAIAVIAEQDFPSNWPTLIPELVVQFDSADFSATIAVLRAIHFIIKHWRAEFQSNELYTEIKMVVRSLHDPYLQLLLRTDQLITTSTDPSALKLYFNALEYMVKIFYTFCIQDLVEKVEDNLAAYMDVFYRYLAYTNAQLDSPDESEAGPVENVKAAICRVVDLFTTRYEEQFERMGDFVSVIWNLLTTMTMEARHDLLVHDAMQFITAVVRHPRHKSMFENPSVQAQVCEKVIIPNIVLRDSDVELFEDDPADYIRRDIEGSDAHTRRKAAAELLAALATQFEESVVALMQGQIAAFLQRFAANGDDDRAFDAALHLYTTLAPTGQVTQAGIVHLRKSFDPSQFFGENIVPVLQLPSGKAVLAQVASVKFIHSFRAQLTKSVLAGCLNRLVDLLGAENVVLHTYSAITIERVLALKDKRTLMFTPADIAPISETLMGSIIHLVVAAKSAEKVAENEYFMKALMRVVITAAETTTAYTFPITERLTQIVGIVHENPSNPRFNHYLFEAISSLIKFACKANPATGEQLTHILFPMFQAILQKDVAEFTPYVFQIMSQLLKASPAPGIPEPYAGLLQSFLVSSLWEQKGNVPALTILLRVYIERGLLEINPGVLNSILGTFQRLVASKSNDTYGFDILEAVIRYSTFEQITPVFPSIVMLLLQRLQGSTTSSFSKRFTMFMLYCSAVGGKKFAGSVVPSTLDAIQPGLALSVFLNVMLAETENITNAIDRKICAVGLVEWLLKTPLLTMDNAPEAWPKALHCCSWLASSTMAKGDAYEGDVDLEELSFSGYSSSFSKLTAIASAKTDPLPEIRDIGVYMANSLVEYDRLHPGQIGGLMPSLDMHLQVFIGTCFAPPVPR